MSELIVHQIPGGWGLPSVGPFSLKLEAYLRIVAIPYRAVAEQEIHAIGKRDVGAIADVLGEKQFIMGAAATEIDAVAYGFLANIMLVPIASPVKDEALGRTNLVDFVARIQEHYFA